MKPPKQPVRYLVEPTGDGRWRLSAVTGGTLHASEEAAKGHALLMSTLNERAAEFGSWEPS